MDNDPNAPPSAKKVGKASNAECTLGWACRRPVWVFLSV